MKNISNHSIKFRFKSDLDPNPTLEIDKTEKPNKLKVYMRLEPFTTFSGIVNLHPTKGTHLVIFSDDYYFDAYGCRPSLSALNQLKSKHGKKIYNTYKKQKQDSLCASYHLYVLYLCLF